MDLDNMKELWQKMDDSIRQQQTVNENIIKRMLNEKNTTSLKSIMNLEWLGIFVAVVVLTLMLGQVARFDGGSTGLMACYIISLLIMVAAAFFGLYKIYFLTRLDADTPVSHMAEKMGRFSLIIAKERLVSLVVGPLMVVMFYVVILFLVTGINALDNPMRFAPILGIAVVVYIVTVLALYKKLYFEQIQKINNNLREIAEFKK